MGCAARVYTLRATTGCAGLCHVFLLLSVALTSTLSPLAYFISLRFISSRLHRATMRHALRQGTLLSLWIVFNLLLRALHSWNLFIAIVSLGIIIVIEVLSLGSK
jgi:hypothetical protein